MTQGRMSGATICLPAWQTKSVWNESDALNLKLEAQKNEFCGVHCFAFASRLGLSQVGLLSEKIATYSWFAKTGKFSFIIWGNKVNVIEKNDDVLQLCDI